VLILAAARKILKLSCLAGVFLEERLAQIGFSITPLLQKAVIFARDAKKPSPGANQSQVLWAWILYMGYS
jgi:hypothetical protein